MSLKAFLTLTNLADDEGLYFDRGGNPQPLHHNAVPQQGCNRRSGPTIDEVGIRHVALLDGREDPVIRHPGRHDLAAAFDHAVTCLRIRRPLAGRRLHRLLPENLDLLLPGTDLEAHSEGTNLAPSEALVRSHGDPSHLPAVLLHAFENAVQELIRHADPALEVDVAVGFRKDGEAVSETDVVVAEARS